MEKGEEAKQVQGFYGFLVGPDDSNTFNSSLTPGLYDHSNSNSPMQPMELPPPRYGDHNSVNRHLTAGGTVEGIPRENKYRTYYLLLMKKRMGTNYYYKDKYCQHCGRRDEKHIGKSSAGWQFTFRLPEGVTFNSIDQMKEHLTGRLIINEYGEEITHDEFWEMVEHKQGDKRATHRLIDVQGYDFIDCEFS